VSQDPNIKRAADLTNMIGQIGCVTGIVALGIIGIAFGAGWLLDDLMGNERRIFTVIFMLASFPVTTYAMVRISLWMVGGPRKVWRRRQIKTTGISTAT
jgi:hypothetical protein